MDGILLYAEENFFLRTFFSILSLISQKNVVAATFVVNCASVQIVGQNNFGQFNAESNLYLCVYHEIVNFLFQPLQ